MEAAQANCRVRLQHIHKTLGIGEKTPSGSQLSCFVSPALEIDILYNNRLGGSKQGYKYNKVCGPG